MVLVQGGASSSLQIFRLLWSPVEWLFRGLGLVFQLISIFISFVTFLLANFHWVILFFLLIAINGIWLPHHSTILESGEFTWRCAIYKVWENPIKPLWEVFVEVYNQVICWSNAIALINRTFSIPVLVYTLTCPEDPDVSIFNTFLKGGNSLLILVRDGLRWAFNTNHINTMYPAYNFLNSLTFVVEDFQGVLTCFCEDLRMIWFWLSKIFQSQNMICFWHQVVNVYIGVYQGVMNFLLEMIRFVAGIIELNGDLSAFFRGLADGTFILPSVSKIYEKVNAAAYYLGEWLNDAAQISVCVVIAEMEAAGNVTAVEEQFEICMQREDTRIEWFCAIGPAFGAFTRYQKLTFTVIINFPRILYEFFNLPPGPRFLTDDWKTDILWDTFRHPPIKYDHNVNISFPPEIPGSNVSSIDPPNSDLYGNWSFPIDWNCSQIDPPVDRRYVPCRECDRVQNITLVECACRLGPKLDDVVEQFIGKRLFEPFLCCVFGSAVRVAAGVMKFIVDFVTHIIVIDRLENFMVEQNNVEVVITEAVGRPQEFGGVLGCICILVRAIDPRLECLCRMILMPAKAVGELMRVAMTSLVRLMQDVFGYDTPRFFDYVCLGYIDDPVPEQCMIRENVLRWLRRPREVVFPNYHFEYTPVAGEDIIPGDNRVFADCVCELVNLKFIGQFLDWPDIPDLCCPFNFAFRMWIDRWDALAAGILSITETFGSLIDSDKPITFVPVKHIACGEKAKVCWRGDLISEMEDFRLCPCTFFEGLDELLSPGNPILLCFCELFEGFLTVLPLMRASYTLWSAHFQLLDCLFTGFPSPHCDTEILKFRYQGYWNHLIDHADSLGFWLRSLGCFIGTIFSYDCLGTAYYVDPPEEPCRAGTNPGQCTPAERLTVMFGDIYLYTQRTTVWGYALGRAITDLAFSVVLDFTGIPNTIPDLIRDFLLTFGEPLFGDPSLDPPTGGLGQSTGLAINCILGPPGGGCSEFGHPNDGACMGDIIWILADVCRDVWEALVNFIVGSIAVLLTLFVNPSNLGNAILEWIISFFDLLVIIVKSLQRILDAIIGVIVGLISFIFGEAVGEIFRWVLFILTGIFRGLLELISLLFGIFAKKKRSLNEDIEELVNKTKQFYEKDEKKINETMDSRTESVARQFQKRTAETIENYHVYVMEYARDAMITTNISKEDQNRLSSVEHMLEDMTPDTFCHKVVNHLKDRKGTDDMNLWEEFLWTGCYTAYAVPIILNSRNDTRVHLPRDIFYNIETFSVVGYEFFRTTELAYDYVTQIKTPFQNIIAETVNLPGDTWWSKKRDLSASDFPEPGILLGMHNLTYANHSIDGNFSYGLSTEGQCTVVSEVASFNQYMQNKGIKTNFVKEIFATMVESSNRISSERFSKMMTIIDYRTKEYEWIREETREMARIEMEAAREKRAEDVRRAIQENPWQKTGVIGNRSYVKIKSKYQRIMEYMRSEKRNSRFKKITKEERQRLIDSYKPGHKYDVKSDEDKQETLNRLESSIEHYNESLLKILEERKRRQEKAEEMKKKGFKKKREYQKRAAEEDAHLPWLERWYKRYERRIKGDYESYKKRGFIEEEDEVYEEPYEYNPIRAKYGHKLGNRTLFAHRWWAFRKGIFDILHNHEERVNKEGPDKARLTYANQILDKHAQAHAHGRVLGIQKVFITYKAFRKTSSLLGDAFPPLNDETRKILNPTVTELRNHVASRKRSGEALLDYDESVFDESEIQKAMKKRGLQVHGEPPLDICINRAEVLTCAQCDTCTSFFGTTCTACESCINCLDNGAGNITCDKCSLCRGEGPVCNECVGCSTCETESICANCKLIQDFAAVALDHVLFCNALYNNDTSVIRVPPPNVSFIEIVPLDANTTFTGDIVSTFFNDLINNIFGVNVVETLVAFITNTNLDPAIGPIGLYFWVRQLPIPFLGRCDRDIHTMCTYGMGFEKGFIISIIIFSTLGIFMWFIAPPISGVFTYLIGIFGAGTAFLWLVGILSWNYNIQCTGTPVSLLVILFYPPYWVPPVLPQCMAQEIFDFWNKIMQPCYDFIVALQVNSDTCLTCPQRAEFPDCRDFGFTGWTRSLSFPWQKYSPATYTFVNNTCLVQGGCTLDLFLPDDLSGPLAPIFDFDFNFTNANQTQQLDECFYITLPSFITPILALAVLYIFATTFGAFIIGFLTWLFEGLTNVFPFNLLLPWNTQKFFFEQENNSSTSGARPFPRRPPKKKPPSKPDSGGTTKYKVDEFYHDSSNSSSSSSSSNEDDNEWVRKYANTTKEAFFNTASSILVSTMKDDAGLRRRRVAGIKSKCK